MKARTVRLTVSDGNTQTTEEYDLRIFQALLIAGYGFGEAVDFEFKMTFHKGVPPEMQETLDRYGRKSVHV